MLGRLEQDMAEFASNPPAKFEVRSWHLSQATEWASPERLLNALPFARSRSVHSSAFVSCF